MKSFLLIIIAFVFGCYAIKDRRRISFEYSIQGKQNVISFIIPKPQNINKITAGGEGQENQYLYEDSSIFYISSLSGSPTVNELLINSSIINYNKRFNYDTISFSGLDQAGLYWKEVKYYNIFYGYAKVPIEKLENFEKVLRSAKLKSQ